MAARLSRQVTNVHFSGRSDTAGWINYSAIIIIMFFQRQEASEIFVDPFVDAETAAEVAYLAAFSFDELKMPKSRVNQPPISCFTAHLDNDPDGFQTRRK